MCRPSLRVTFGQIITHFCVDHLRCLWLFTLLWSSSLHIISVEQRSLKFLILHLQSARQKMDPRSDSGRESVSSQWWEGVDKKSFVNFVLLSLGGRRQRKADNQWLICAFILCMSTSLYSVSRRDRSSPLTDLHQWTMSLWHSMVCHAVLSRRRGDNHSFSLRRKLENMQNQWSVFR